MRCSPRPSHRSDRSRPNGFALLLVIWVLALLSMLAAGLAADTRSEDRAVRTMVGLARARATADAGITLAVAALIGPDLAGPWPVDGTVKTVRYDDREINITVEDEGGKIDLNAAPPELIVGLVNELAGDDDLRDRVVDGIMRRRQSFAAAAAGPGPPPVTVSRIQPLGSLPFAAVTELRLVAGMSDSLYARLRPFVTVYTQAPTINPMTARRETLLAVPGISPQEVDLYIAGRAAITNDPGEVAPSPLSSGRNLFAGNPLKAATIIATAVDDSGVSFAREAVVAMKPGNALQPYAIMSWTQPLAADLATGDADALQ